MLEQPFDLTDRVAIVTGGGTGIGAATAHVLARFGADVVVASRKLEALEVVAREVAAATGRRCLPIATDVRREDQVGAMVAWPILFLVSDAARYVTGDTFGVNGGPPMRGLPEPD